MKKQTWKRAAAGVMAMAMTFGYASAGSVSAADNVLHSATEAPSYMSDLTQKMLGNYIEEGSYQSPISAYTVADPEKSLMYSSLKSLIFVTLTAKTMLRR